MGANKIDGSENLIRGDDIAVVRRLHDHAAIIQPKGIGHTAPPHGETIGWNQGDDTGPWRHREEPMIYVAALDRHKNGCRGKSRVTIRKIRFQIDNVEALCGKSLAEGILMGNQACDTACPSPEIDHGRRGIAARSDGLS